jgi:hypothetical protein
VIVVGIRAMTISASTPHLILFLASALTSVKVAMLKFILT